MRLAVRSLLRTLLHHPALNFEQEPEDHFAIFLRDLHKFHSYDGPSLPLYNGIDDGHAFTMQDQHCGANQLAFVELIKVLCAYKSGPGAPELIDDGIDIHAVQTQQQKNRLIRNHRQPESLPFLNIRVSVRHYVAHSI